MTNTPGGKVLVGSKKSEEPAAITNRSPVVAFKGYGR